MRIVLVFFIFAGSISACTRKTCLKKIDSYLNASSIQEKSKYLADDYLSYFMEVKGNGETKTEALNSFKNWDGVLNPDVKILDYFFKRQGMVG